MSSSYVRQLVRKWAEEAAALRGVPYYDTVNREQRPTDDVWFTLSFISEYSSGTFCQPNYIETGAVSFVFFARPGTGDAECLSAVESIIPDIMNKVDPTQRLALQNYEPVDEYSDGSTDKDYELRVLVNYHHSL